MNAFAQPAMMPAWNDSVHDAQATFRCILKALSEPGSIQTLPLAISGPAPLHTATTAACLALADFETPLWLDDAARTSALEKYLRFHCGCRLTADAATASFAVITDAASGIDLDRFAQGTLEYPDRSATLLVQVPTLTKGPARTLSGPGIEHARTLNVGGLASGFDAQWRLNHARFPLGVDILFCCGNMIAGLPRTTAIDS